MKPPRQHSRVDLAELKAQFVKKLGSEGSKQYFSFLHRFLSSKMTKFEFNKLCLRILGRENIPLHNQFVSSILKNVCTAKSPPPTLFKDDASKHRLKVGSEEIVGNGYHPNGSHGILPISPRRPRTGVSRHCSAQEKTQLAPRVTAHKSGDSDVVLEQNHQEFARTSENENVILASHVSNMSNVGISQDSSSLELRKAQADVLVRNNATHESAKSPLQGNSKRSSDMFSRGALLDNVELREQMENIAVFQGLKGVSEDCAEILNRGLDFYLKGLIRSCIELVGERSGTKNDSSYKNQQPHTTKLINGLGPGYQPQLQNSSSSRSVSVTLQDFRVATELNPQKLGEDWPLSLEKISTRALEGASQNKPN